MDKQVIIIGGEGNGGVIASCIEDNRKRFNDLKWEVAGFINDNEKQVNEYTVIGGLDSISELLKNTDYYFIWAIHLIGRNVLTEQLYKKANIPANRLATIIHQSAFVAYNAVLEPGVFIMANSYIGSKAVIGESSLIMANSMIGHNTKMGPLCHCSVGSIMVAYSQLGTCSDLAVGSILLSNVKIGNCAMAGAGSLVSKDIPDHEIHVGSPAKFLKFGRKD
ncbi:MAG: Transferase hexapeptide repeat protein [uncultured bacterium]|nr:MAG: Transferase hexapeptide repeat protein [uncultured bacterium]